MIKRGLITDLARVSHSLDLSSPNVSTTINAVLKPLETLSRIVNQPSSILSTSNNKPKARNGPISSTITEGEPNNSTEGRDGETLANTNDNSNPDNELSPSQGAPN